MSKDHYHPYHKVFLIIFLWCIMVFQAASQGHYYTYDIRKLSVEDGLSNRFVREIFEDSNGFMWIATDFGLNRYDGYEFKTYTAENSGLSFNNASFIEIFEDKNQKLWLNYTKSGQTSIDLFDLETEQVTSFHQAFGDRAPFAEKDVLRVTGGNEHEIWICTRSGQLYGYEDNQFKLVFADQLLGQSYFDDQTFWPQKRGNDELYKIDKRGERLMVIKANDPIRVKDLQNDRIVFFEKDQPGWLKTIDSQGKKRKLEMEPLGLPDHFYKLDQLRLYMDSYKGLLWLLSYSGSYVFKSNGTLIYNVSDLIKPYITYDNLIIYDMFIDSESRAWAATNDGLFVISISEKKFSTSLDQQGQKYSLRGMVEDQQGRLFIIPNASTQRFVIPQGRTEAIRQQCRGWGLGAAKDLQGNLWFSGVSSVVEKYSPQNGESQYYEYNGMAPGPHWNWSILSDETGRIWVGSNNKGLYLLEPETGAFEIYGQYNEFPTLGNSSIYHLHEDKKGLWIAASTGLYRLEWGRGITARYASGEISPYHLPYDHILHFYRDKSGVFWLATKGGGLIRFNPEDGSYQGFTVENGLSNNILYAVYEDEFGYLWLPSNYGLMRFHKKTHRVNTYFTEDGLAHDEFNTISHYQSTDGKLYFGGLSGVTFFDPKDFVEWDTSGAPLRVTDCKILNSQTGELHSKTWELTNNNQLRLLPVHKSIMLTFSLLNYEKHKNSYAYKIEGLDKVWNLLPGNTLHINGLPYGHHTLRIKGHNVKDQSATKELIIPIWVIRPLYLEPWFLSVCVLVLLLLVFGVFYWRVSSLKRNKERLQGIVKQRTLEIRSQKEKIEQQVEQLKSLDEAKSRFFANISHELRTPLTLLNGHIEAILGGQYGKLSETIRPRLQIASRNGKRLTSLIEEVLDLSRMESGELQLQEKPIVFYPLLNRLFDMFRSFAAQKRQDFILHYDLPPDLIVELDEDKFEKILANLLANATKFTPEGGKIEMTVSFAHEKSHRIEIKVSDTGRGIHPEDLPHIFSRFYQTEQHTLPLEGGAGIGLALVNELVQLFGGEIKVESEWGEGSTFYFLMPKKTAKTNRYALDEEAYEGEYQLSYTASEAESDMEETLQPLHGPEAPKGAPRILIVEDHLEMRAFIKEKIASSYQVCEAGDGVEALAILEGQPIDLIVSDVMMPRMDGFRLLDEVRSNKKTSHLPIIILTARAAKEDRLNALLAGVDDYLTKPFDEGELLVRIRYLLSNRTQREQWTGKTSADAGEEGRHPLPMDLGFTEKAQEIVRTQLDNAHFGVIDMAQLLGVSQRQLFRKLKSASGLSPLQFIREIRLQQARTMLENRETETVAEVMYTVGFQKSNYFAKVYRERFGRRPSEYI